MVPESRPESDGPSETRTAHRRTNTKNDAPTNEEPPRARQGLGARRTAPTTRDGDPVEFGIFVQGYVPRSRSAIDPDAEHHALMEETEYVIAADRAGFKYAWASEHHFLDEYSHLSANDVFLGYLAHATERIHLGSGIFNPL